ncbi:hypothetical protein C1H46_006933 [Malus baccata]|uniref:Uncharacterized protein n=1 Tax=Malus baccata TaxID=106549 RepID=A0A540N8U0_MALBA|nr:hypothetical protein C1H46_006933 [Malus baccata]
MPNLAVNKIGFERVEEMKVVGEKSVESNVGDLELKGMCFSMRRDLEELEKENREMKRRLEDMKFGGIGEGK